MRLARWEVVWTSFVHAVPQHHSYHWTLYGARSYAHTLNRVAGCLNGVDFFARRRV